MADEQKKVSASVVYNPGPDDPVEVTWGGKKFVKGEAVEISDPAMIEKAKTNKSFNVDGEDKAKDAATAAAKKKQDQDKAYIAALEAEGIALEKRQDGEVQVLEQKQQMEREAFKARYADAKKTIAASQPGAERPTPTSAEPPITPKNEEPANPQV